MKKQPNKDRYIAPVALGASCKNPMMKEGLDCTVRALANAKEIPYEEAHAIMASFGRQQGKGCAFDRMHEAYSSNGLEFVCSFGTTLDATWVSSVIGGYRLSGRSVKSLLKELQNGKYIVSVRKHVFAVIDGEIVDNMMISGNIPCTALYKVVE